MSGGFELGAASKPTRQQVIAALEIMRAHYDSEIGEGLQDFYQVENRVLKHIDRKLVQSMISDYFRDLKCSVSCFRH